MEVGSYTYGHYNIQTFSWGENSKLSIGKFCSIGKNVKIYLGGNHRVDWITTFPFGHIHQNVFNGFDGTGHPTSKGNVFIGNDVWIAENVTIMSGVHVGDGAVIANNSHVVKNVPPYCIVGGNPAQIIKKRFDDNIIENLLTLKWWDWSEDKINKNLPLLCSNNINDINALL